MKLVINSLDTVFFVLDHTHFLFNLEIDDVSVNARAQVVVNIKFAARSIIESLPSLVHRHISEFAENHYHEIKEV